MPASRSGSSSLLEDRVGVHAAERDLGGADQAELVAGDGVDLALFAARAEAERFDHVGARQIGRHDREEALGHDLVEGEALERQLEQRRLALQEVELLARDLRRALEVDEVEGGGEGEVVLRLEVEAAEASPRSRAP